MEGIREAKVTHTERGTVVLEMTNILDLKRQGEEFDYAYPPVPRDKDGRPDEFQLAVKDATAQKLENGVSQYGDYRIFKASEEIFCIGLFTLNNVDEFPFMAIKNQNGDELVNPYAQARAGVSDNRLNSRCKAKLEDYAKASAEACSPLRWNILKKGEDQYLAYFVEAEMTFVRVKIKEFGNLFALEEASDVQVVFEQLEHILYRKLSALCVQLDFKSGGQLIDPEYESKA